MKMRLTMKGLTVLSATLTLACSGSSGGDSESRGDSDTATGTTQGQTSTTDTATSTSSTSSDTGTGSMSDGTTTTATSGSTSAGTSTSAGETTGAPTTSTSGGSTGSTGGTTDGGTTTGGICEPGDMMGMGMVEKSYIFIPSQDLDDVAKVNTQTLAIEARYKIGPGGESASRTAVSGDGRFVVVNNRQTGRSTMLAANLDDCVDKNNNGMIETSSGPGDVKPWGQDECVLWQIQWPYGGAWHHGPRGITWTPGTWDYDLCKYVNPKIWLGYMSQQANTVHFVRVAVDGTVEETIPVPNWNGSGFSPYGGALDPDFNPWFSSLRGEFVRINANENPVTIDRFTPPGQTQSYGFTVDPDGNPWFGGNCGPITKFDPMTQQYTAIPGTENGCWRGVGADENYVWVANNSPCQLAQVDRKNNTLVANHNTNPCSIAIGLSVDVEKYVWLVDQGGWAWKIDPDNVPGMQQVIVPGSHYVYSDMTGGQLQSILPQ